MNRPSARAICTIAALLFTGCQTPQPTPDAASPATPHDAAPPAAAPPTAPPRAGAPSTAPPLAPALPIESIPAPRVAEAARPPAAAAPQSTPTTNVSVAALPPGPPLYTLNEPEIGEMAAAAKAAVPDLAARVVALGRRNIGQPYDIYLLGEYPFEAHDPDPIYCLTHSDCVTFVEHTLALALADDWWSFLQILQRIRYRDGEIGMVTRNHFTLPDWNPANAFFIDDITTTLGGGGAHAPLVERVRRTEFFRKFGLEQQVANTRHEDAYIPTENVPGVEAELRDGDLVNIIRGNDDGMWAGHMGMIVRGPDGAVHLLHSAAPAVREQRLMDYLRTNARCKGVKILRLKPDAPAQMAAAIGAQQATDVSDEAMCAALRRSPLMPTGAPAWYVDEWTHAMDIQSFKLTPQTRPEPRLQAALEQVEADIAAELGIPEDARAIGVIDLRDVRFAAVGPDRLFYGASVPKIAIVGAYLAGVGPDISAEVERELELILKRSDNELAAKYSQIVGLEAIQKWLQSPDVGLWDPNVGGLWCGKHYGVETPRIGDPIGDNSHAMTVRACLRFYLLMEQGKLANARVSARLKQLFAAPRLEFHNKDFIRGLNGRGAHVLRKSGLWEEWQLDTARVHAGDRLYLLAGATRHPRGGEYLAKMAAAIDSLLGGTDAPTPYTHQLLVDDTPAEFDAGVVSAGAIDWERSKITLLRDAAGALAAFESAVLAPERKFNQVVASANVDLAPGAGFALQVRVGRFADDSWSPWLAVLEAGEPPPGIERVIEFDGGKIDIDYFRSDQLYDRAQYRVVGGWTGESAEPIEIRRVAMCLSDMSGIPDSVAAPAKERPALASGAWQRRLPAPFRSQKVEDKDLAGRICSPTSVSMVVAYHGVNHRLDDMVAATFDPRHTIYGNWPMNVQAAYTFGVPGYLARFSDWADVEAEIAAGRPLVLSIRVPKEGDLRGAPYRTTDGHLIVLTGFDTQGRCLVNDPAAADAERGELVYERADLEKCWMRATGGLTYVFWREQSVRE